VNPDHLFVGSISDNIKDRPKAFWSFIKSKTTTRESVGILQIPDGTTAHTDQDKAETLNAFFSSVFTAENAETPTSETFTSSETDTITFTEEDIQKHISHLRTDKSAGPDNISPRLLKETSPVISRALYILFRRSLDERKIPKAWKEATISPVLKKGSKSDPGNYRPISLTRVVGKLLEGLTRQGITDHLNKNKLLSESQFGFRSGRSCQLQLLETLDRWTEDLDNGQSIDVLFFDYSNAFDTVPHKRLLSKIKAHGITGNLLEWIQDFLTDRKQRVAIHSSVSTWESVLSGVPQGSVLGPTLFLLSVNDLPNV
jgi:hypothetical protein